MCSLGYHLIESIFHLSFSPWPGWGIYKDTFIYLKDSSAERGRDTSCPLTHSQNSLSARSSMVQSRNLGLSQRPIEWQNPKHWDLCCCFPKCISIYTLVEEPEPDPATTYPLHHSSNPSQCILKAKMSLFQMVSG